MSKKIKALLFVLPVFLFVGCASGPSYRQYADTIPPVLEGQSRIYLYRTTTLGTAVQPQILVNDLAVGKAKPKGFFYVDLPPGDHVISASTEAERSLNINLDPNEVAYIRLEMKMGAFVGHVKPVLVDTTVGKSEIEKTKLISQ